MWEGLAGWAATLRPSPPHLLPLPPPPPLLLLLLPPLQEGPAGSSGTVFLIPADPRLPRMLVRRDGLPHQLRRVLLEEAGKASLWQYPPEQYPSPEVSCLPHGCCFLMVCALCFWVRAWLGLPPRLAGWFNTCAAARGMGLLLPSTRPSSIETGAPRSRAPWCCSEAPPPPPHLLRSPTSSCLPAATHPCRPTLNPTTPSTLLQADLASRTLVSGRVVGWDPQHMFPVAQVGLGSMVWV